METIEQLKQSRDTWEDIAQNCRKDLEQQVNCIVELRAENKRLRKKLEYCYEKTYLILNNLDETHDVVKMFDAIEEFKPIKIHNA